jgi:hypothetical protein
MKTEQQRMEELLALKDAEIERLSEELTKAEDRREKDWEWAEHLDFGDEHHPQLPIPRLEMEWRKDGDTWQHCTCLYRLIYRHLLGHVVGVPMGETSTQSSAEHSPAEELGHRKGIRTPFRDGVHIAKDSEHLKLPAFVICEHRIEIITMRDGEIHQEPFNPPA